MHTRSLFIIAAVAAVTLVACKGRGTKPANRSVADTIAIIHDKAIVGQWYIRTVVLNDSLYARPSEITPGVRQYITFNGDSTVNIKTNCNGMSGRYTIKGDSLTISDLCWTEMACKNMDVERLLQRILPEIRTCEIENDSILRLNAATSDEYVLLRKAMEKK
ncbi:hypothetical protein K020075H21_04370 [Bacteroides ovatus]|uniref:META domain-containing protein n=1 Tax=Bacteroides ovatus TaxID=28116 RepID=UPI0034B8B39C